MSSGVEHVYLAKMGNYFKIGYSRDPQDRIERMTGITLPPEYKIGLVFSAVRESARSVETLLHRKFADSRVGGEWFCLTDTQVVDVIELMKHGALDAVPCKEIKPEHMSIASAVCVHCDHRWIPRVANPVKCIKCQKRWPTRKKVE